MNDIPGIDVLRVSEWLESNVTGARGPFSFEVIAGGHSNLTFRVAGSDGAVFVLRRPPLGHRLASAHDMAREHRIISALQGSQVPVPPVFGLCTDPGVNSEPFYVMGFVDGHVIRDRDVAERSLNTVARRHSSESLVDTLAAIHAVDLNESGLADLGKHEGYIARQLKRWHAQWNEQKTRDVPEVDRVHEVLSAQIPEQGRATLVHGDFRLDNCIVGDDGNVRAVLDWEICTLGDPMADLGLLAVYWTGPNDEPSPWGGTSTVADGFLDRDDLVARYAAASGRDISQLPFYISFAYWKLACILQGVYYRYLGGALGLRDPVELEPFAAQIDGAVERAARCLEAQR